MRIGTFNLAGGWTTDHQGFLEHLHCDVWLLTKVRTTTEIPGMCRYTTSDLMAHDRWWAAVFSSSEAVRQDDPHRATVAVCLDGITFISSVLPWRSCGPSWEGVTLGEKMQRTLGGIRPHISGRTVWGGDWNQALEGRDHTGSASGRAEVADLVRAAGLMVPTACLGSAVPGHPAIDHIAVPSTWDVTTAERVRAQVGGKRLSDHDAYVISVNR